MGDRGDLHLPEALTYAASDTRQTSNFLTIPPETSGSATLSQFTNGL